VTIRPARPEDVPALAALLRDTGIALEEVPYDDFSHPTLVAEAGGRVVGMLQCLLGKPCSVMTEMAVVPDYQHQGIGQALLSEMEDFLRSLGVTTWLAYSGEKRTAVKTALERYGATCSGRGFAFVRTMS
jgi:N-acetylglutamate synthase-like GNAT family acetyltransferase